MFEPKARLWEKRHSYLEGYRAEVTAAIKKYKEGWYTLEKLQ